MSLERDFVLGVVLGVGLVVGSHGVGVGVGVGSGVLFQEDLILILAFLVDLFRAALVCYVFIEIVNRRNPVNHRHHSSCTCAETQYVRCHEIHDPDLLYALSRNIPDENLMTELGLKLHVPPNHIMSCLRDNRSINFAAFYMLYDKWYHTQDGLGLRSQGLARLKQALVEVGRANYINAIIDRHFDER